MQSDDARRENEAPRGPISTLDAAVVRINATCVAELEMFSRGRWREGAGARDPRRRSADSRDRGGGARVLAQPPLHPRERVRSPVAPRPHQDPGPV